MTLILGLTSSARALHGVLEPSILDRCLRCTPFRLASALDRLDRLVADALLGTRGQWPALLFGSGVVGRAWDLCLLHHFSSSVVAQSLRIAAVDLLFVEGDGRAAAKKGRSNGDSSAPPGASLLRHMDRDGLASWARWALAVHALVWLGQALQHARGCEYWRTYRDALDPLWVKAEGGRLLATLGAGLRGLGEQALASTLRGLHNVFCDKAVDATLVPEIKELQGIVQGLENVPKAGAPADDAKGSSAQQPEAATTSPSPQDQANLDRPGAQQAKRFHSRASRRTALLGSALANAAAPRAAEAKRPKAPSPRETAVAWVVDFLGRALGTDLGSLSGAESATAAHVDSLACLSGNPREVLMGGWAQYWMSFWENVYHACLNCAYRASFLITQN